MGAKFLGLAPILPAKSDGKKNLVPRCQRRRSQSAQTDRCRNGREPTRLGICRFRDLKDGVRACAKALWRANRRLLLSARFLVGDEARPARIQPDMLVLVELELWPNLIKFANKSGAKVAIVNGRVSGEAFQTYFRIRRFLASTFEKSIFRGAGRRRCKLFQAVIFRPGKSLRLRIN